MGLFNSSEDYDHFTLEEMEEMERAFKKEKEPNKWINIIDKLSNGDITKHEEIYKTNYIHSLNMLSYWKTIKNYQELIFKTINQANAIT